MHLSMDKPSVAPTSTNLWSFGVCDGITTLKKIFFFKWKVRSNWGGGSDLGIFVSNNDVNDISP
jgi:hypothetical protein